MIFTDISRYGCRVAERIAKPSTDRYSFSPDDRRTAEDAHVEVPKTVERDGAVQTETLKVWLEKRVSVDHIDSVSTASKIR